MGPHNVIWFPTKEVSNVGEWLREKGITPHPGWVIRKNPDGSYSHEEIDDTANV